MVEIKFDMPDLYAELMKHKRDIDLAVAASMQANRAMLFDTEGKHNGREGWAPLAFRVGMILSKRGVLRKSMAPPNPTGQAGNDGIVEFRGNEVTIGTRLGYARLMNDGTVKMPGGVLRPTKAKALKIPLPSGKSATDAANSLRNKNIDKQMKKLNERYAKAKTAEARAKINKQYDKLIDKKVERKGSGGFIFRKSVRIPARPFDDWNTADEDELMMVLVEKIAQVLNGQTR